MAWLERYMWLETSRDGWYAFDADGFHDVAKSVHKRGSLSTDTCISNGQVNAGSDTTVQGSRQQ